MIYFECKLPKSLPHLDVDLNEKYVLTAERISRRTEKLQAALEISGLNPETFHQITSQIFNFESMQYGNVDHFDALSADELATLAKASYCGIDKRLPRVDWPNCDVLFDTAFTTTEDWALNRHIGIGGSDSAIIHGVEKYRSEYQLYHDKLGTELPEQGYNPAFERGHVMEDKVIEAFCSRTGAKRIVDTRMFRSKTHPHCIADIDAILQFPNGKLYIFEAKSTKYDNQEIWQDNSIPPQYAYQVRHYPAVLNDERIEGTYIGCSFVIDLTACGKYVGSLTNQCRFVSHLFERDIAIEQDILNENENWWLNHIVCGCEPPLSLNLDDKTDAAQMKTFAAVNGPGDPALPPIEMENTSELYPLAKRYLAAIETEKEAAKVKSSISKIFTEMMKEHTKVVFREDDINILEVGLSPQGPKTTVDTAGMKELYPEIFEKFTTVDPLGASRRFTVKIKKAPKKK